MSKTSNFFWGGILIVLGGLFLIDSLGIMEINLWRIFWPLMLILLGGWVLVGYFWRDNSKEGEKASIPLEGARNAVIRLQHGAGQLTIGSDANPMDLVTGVFGGGLRSTVRRDGDGVDVKLRVKDGSFPFVVAPWFWGPRNYLEWDLNLTDEIPLDLRLNTGASDTRLNLTDLQVTNLRVDTGASATEINLPDGVAHTKVLVKAGAASVKINVPEMVAARIYVTGGLMGSSVNQARFPKSGGYYQSAEYETAPHKVEIRVNIGLGSATVQ